MKVPTEEELEEQEQIPEHADVRAPTEDVLGNIEKTEYRSREGEKDIDPGTQCLCTPVSAL